MSTWEFTFYLFNNFHLLVIEISTQRRIFCRPLLIRDVQCFPFRTTRGQHTSESVHWCEIGSWRERVCMFGKAPIELCLVGISVLTVPEPQPCAEERTAEQTWKCSFKTREGSSCLERMCTQWSLISIILSKVILTDQNRSSPLILPSHGP